MKKLFFLASALLFTSTMSVSARVYVQTANEADPRWTVTLGENDKLITFTSVADLPTTECKEIWFAGGTYVFDKTFAIAQIDAVLAGGFSGTETSLDERQLLEDGEAWEFTHETIIDGGGNVKLFADSKRTSFDGLTMKNASVSGNGAICRLSNGIDNNGLEHAPFVKNCKCMSNKATGQGGCFTMFSLNADVVAPIVIENCYFDNNVAGTQGGAIYANLNACQLLIRGCYFKDNSATGTSNAGGAIHAQNNGVLTVEGCFFDGNTAKGQGTALSNDTKTGESLVFNNVFVNNGAESVSKCVVLMVTGDFYYNTIVESYGDALWQKAGNVKNNVFYATTLAKAHANIEKAAVYTNNAGVQAWAEGADETNIVISLNNKPAEGDAEGTKYAYFADPDNHDFALQEGSALIKAGVAIETITTDIDGEQRKTADIGAYAYEGTGTAVENIAKPAVDIRAALEAGEVYNILGQRVSDISAGNIYIVSGQKMLVR